MLGASNMVATFSYLPPGLAEYLLESVGGLVSDTESPQAHEVEANNHNQSWIALLEPDDRELIKCQLPEN